MVVAKYLAALAFYAIMLGVTLTLPLSLLFLGSPDPGPILGGYLGAFLLGAAYIAVGNYISTVTNEQMVAFIVTGVVLLALLLIGVPNCWTRMVHVSACSAAQVSRCV